MQKISFSVATASNGNGGDTIIGIFKLSYVDGDGIKHTTGDIVFNESAYNSGDDATDPALLMQQALRDLGGDLADVTVTSIDSKNYTIEFGDASNGKNVNMLAMEDADWLAGFLPGAVVSTVSEPFTVSGILVSPTNPNLTALSIEDAFNQHRDTYLTANDKGISSVTQAIPTVEVTSVPTVGDPAGLLTFNIEFTGDTSYENVPTIVIESGAVVDSGGTALNTEDILGVTIKETSDEFRVNPEEPDNPYTQGLDKYTQTNPSVAMDADGEFVIVWESEVPDSQFAGSETDVFARLYTTVGTIDESDVELASGMMWVDMDCDGAVETPIQGVRLVEAYTPYSTLLENDDPLKLEDDIYTFRVNELTSAPQGNASVAMDATGNFTVAWSDSGQDISFFNGINMRQFSYDGTPMTAVEVAVSYEDTEIHDNSYVAMSDDGFALVVWESTSYLWAKVYDPDGNVWSNQRVIEQNAVQATACFDSANNYAISWTAYADIDDENDEGGGGDEYVLSYGVYFVEYTIDGARTRSHTRANSATIYPFVDPYMWTDWPNTQSDSQIIMDADGDLTVVYSGFGPDTNGSLRTPGAANAYMQELLAREENADLLALWPALSGFRLPVDDYNSGDIDSVVEEALAFAQHDYGFNDEQLGRLQAIMESVVDLARGEANGVMYSQFDADPTLGSQNVLISDSVVNSERDGTNARFYMTLSQDITDGTFTLLLVNSMTNATEAVEIEPVYIETEDSQIISGLGTLFAIRDALVESTLLGPDADGEANFILRMLGTEEVELREGTYWDLYADPTSVYIYEISLTNELHDTPFKISLAYHELVTEDEEGNEEPADNPVVWTYTYGTAGTKQSNSSIGMTPDGDFVVAYTEYVSGANNIYYRYYDEGVDTAGPTLTCAETANGVNLIESPVVYQTEDVAYVVLTMSEEMYDKPYQHGRRCNKHRQLPIAGRRKPGRSLRRHRRSLLRTKRVGCTGSDGSG